MKLRLLEEIVSVVLFFSGKIKYHEDSQFKGDHYVECYAVLDNTVIARDRITVPIDPLCGKDFIE
nr:DNA polymerase III subunit delta [Streptococcus pneumoniae]